jgi:hypothetical protein
MSIQDSDIDRFEAVLDITSDLGHEAVFDLLESIDPDGQLYDAWSARERAKDAEWWASLSSADRERYEAMHARVFETVVKPLIERGRAKTSD